MCLNEVVKKQPSYYVGHNKTVLVKGLEKQPFQSLQYQPPL